jgi:hypothetical protein
MQLNARLIISVKSEIGEIEAVWYHVGGLLLFGEQEQRTILP